MKTKGIFKQSTFPDFEVQIDQDETNVISMSDSVTTIDVDGEVQFQEVANFPPFDEINHCDLFALSLSNVTSGMTHSLHRFPAKYIPQIPRWAIRQFGSSGLVVDPFMGSGTTLVEGLLREGRTEGFEVDPLAKLIANAKTCMPNSGRILEIGEGISKQWPSGSGAVSLPMAGIQRTQHWFSDESLQRLRALYDYLEQLDCSESERRYMYTIFSSILRRVSNADDQSQKTYVSGTLPKTPPDVLPTFWWAFRKAVCGLQELEMGRVDGATVHVNELGDALSMPLTSGSVELIVTSPPYMDSVDYMYNLMMEYFWLGPFVGVSTREHFNQLRRASVGAKNPIESNAVLPRSVMDLIDLNQIKAERQHAVIAYMHDMALHFHEAARVLREGGRYVLVIGNSQTMQDAVPVHDALIRLAGESGLQLEKAFGYRIRRHYMKFPRKGRGGIILLDWVIVLRKGVSSAELPGRLPLPNVRIGDSSVAN